MIDELINIFRLSGTEPGELESATRCGLTEAVLLGQIIFIGNQGFLTYDIEDGKVMVRNLCILRPFRGKVNFLYVRKIIKDKYPGLPIMWHNRKTNARRIYGNR